MKIGIVLDPLASIHIEKDTTYAIMVAAQARGHEIWAMQPQDLSISGQTVQAQATPLRLTGDQTHWYEAGEPVCLPLTAFDCVLNRKDPPFDVDYVTLTWLLDQAQAAGARIVNDPAAVRAWNEKLAILRFPQFIVPTLVASQAALLRDFLLQQEDIILKPLTGMGGSGVFRVRRDDPNIGVIIETLTDCGRRTIMAQRFIPEIRDGDKRILVIDGEPAPYVLARVPQPGETRGNLAAGGKGFARPLTPRDREIATTIGPVLKAAGLTIVGLDVIGDYLTEINVTSPTGMQEIERQTGVSLADMTVARLEALCA